MERFELSQELRETYCHGQGQGCDQGDVVMAEAIRFRHRAPGRVEKDQPGGRKRLGLRLFFGNSSASASTSDISGNRSNGWSSTARMAPPPRRTRSADCPAASLARDVPDLDLCDDAARSVAVDEKIQMAIAVEKALWPMMGASPTPKGVSSPITSAG
jgi:hypothetical protein